MATYGDTIEEAKRILQPNGVMNVVLLGAYTAASGTMTLDFNNPMFAAIRPGSILAGGLVLFYVTGTPNAGTGVTAVTAGYAGSVDANLANGSVIEIQPRFSRFDLSRFVNEELLALSAPGPTVLGQVEAIDITYVPAFAGYDLGAGFDAQRSRVLEVSYQIAPPWRTYPKIRQGDWRVIRNQNKATSNFPSGNGIIFYKAAWPGFPIRVQYLAPFTVCAALTDDLLTVAGVPATAQDIVYLGTILRAAPDKEIDRNTLGRQRDPRKATEVPAGAMRAATADTLRRYNERRAAESGYIKHAYKQGESW